MSGPENPFDPAKFADMLAAFDPSKYMPDMSAAGTDPAALKAAQQRNLDQLTAASKAGAEAYKTAFAAQLTMLETALTKAGGPGAEAARDAMQQMAAGVQEANEDTLRQLADQFEQGAEALRALAARTQADD